MWRHMKQLASVDSAQRASASSSKAPSSYSSAVIDSRWVGVVIAHYHHEARIEDQQLIAADRRAESVGDDLHSIIPLLHKDASQRGGLVGLTKAGVEKPA